MVVVLVVFAGVFWFAKNALRQHLVDRNASFSRADRTSWMLWIFLMTAGVAAVVGFISRVTLFVPVVFAPLCAIGLISLLLTIVFYLRSLAR